MKWQSTKEKYKVISKAKWVARKLHLTIEFKHLEFDPDFPKQGRDPWGAGSHMDQTPNWLSTLSESDDVMSLPDTEVDSDESVKAKEFFQSLSMPEKF
jgi:hypothetical protein